MTQDIDPNAVVAFWKAAGPERWFAKDDAFDAEFGRRFMAAHLAAARRDLDDWGATPEGALALLILLDQFPRNVWRGTGHAFATDPLGRRVALQTVAADLDLALENDLRRFVYLPLQHSEGMEDQDRQVELFQTRMTRAPDDRWAEHHRGIIVRFGRFPHRNPALGRDSTPEELAWLAEEGFKG
ncbi:MAG TPA: DUF924 family protein [Brevundimonas sp.]|jgi:uncharacterized protein (DUF924 family)|uniref:DUF924 family protein n=1 Tax=Brevundimonas sp. TaxID=1871086 RepID=UPI002E0EA037|nr:DUF924 family protein [Brevundimonas sp.]